MGLEIKATPIEELVQRGFNKFGDKFECVGHNEATGLYLFKRTPINVEELGGIVSYEVIKPRRGAYPSTSEWGIYAKTFNDIEKAILCLNNGFEWYQNYKAEMRQKSSKMKIC